MLTDYQLEKLCKNMNIPLQSIIFKDECPKTFKFNKSYIINLDDEFDESGNVKSGSHWVALQINKYPNDVIKGMYFDSFGCPPAIDVIKCYKNTTGKDHLPYNTKDVQSLMSNACGWYCCAWLHFINNFSHRERDIYLDTENFLEFFDDLNKSIDFKKNEYILKLFFQPKDPTKRKEIDVIADSETIDTDVNGYRPDIMAMPVEIKYK